MTSMRDRSAENQWIREHPARLELWGNAYSDGFEAGADSRPTDTEIRDWAIGLIERAYRAGYADGWAGRAEDHKEAAGVLCGVAQTAADKDKSASYIPRRGA